MVSAGEPPSVIEAMKMESNVTAPIAGRIKKVHVPAGEQIETGDLLIDHARAGGDGGPGSPDGTHVELDSRSVFLRAGRLGLGGRQARAFDVSLMTYECAWADLG